MKKLSKWFLLACFSVGVVSGVAQPALAATTAKDVSSQPYSDLRKSILDSDSSNSIDEKTQTAFKNKAGIVDQTKLSDKLNVVTGADGLTYVTLGDADTSKKTKQPKGSIEVGIDKKRQAKANAANESVNSFRDVNVNDIKSLQSALNNKNFPFLNEESGKYAANTYESELVHQKTKAYFVEKILDQTGNINDVPSTVTSVSPSMLRAVMSTSVQVGSANKDNDHHNNGLFNFGTLFSGTKVLAASNTNEYHIMPPGAYLMELTQANGTLYSEQYGVYRIINGQSAFCIEPGVKSATSYTASNPRANMDMTEARKNRIASYLTAYNEFGDWVQNQDGFYRWSAAQLLVWSALSPSYRPREAHMVPNSWKGPVQQKRNELQARADVILKSSTWNRTSQTVSKGNNATFTITNANNWGDYHVAIDSVSNGGTASFNGSTVTVNTSKATSNQIVVRMHKGADINKYRSSHPTIWLNGSAQALFTGFLGMTTNLVVNVTPGQGHVQIVKRDSDSKQPLAGAKMRFSYNGKTKDIITGNDGVAKLPDMLNEGTSVNVTEVQAPSNYDLSSSTVTVKSVAGKTTSADFFNNQSLGTGYVTKVDSLTGKPLAGVTFNFSYNGKSKNVTTESDGVAALGENLHKGTVVKIKEVSTIAHYTLDSTEFSMTIQSGGNENIVRKNVPQGQVGIYKKIRLLNEPIAGAKMRFSYNGQTKDIVTDKNGLALLPDWLDAGTVVNVTEVEAPAGFELSHDSVPVTVSAGTQRYGDFFDDINYDATVKKTVSDMNESQANKNTWSLNQNDYLQYDVIGTLDLDGPFTLNKFVLTDYVDTQYVDIKSINVYDSKGAISNDFNISQSNGVITATAKPSLMSDKVSYNNKFILRTTMTIKPAFRNSTADRQSLTITKNGHLSLGISVSGHDTGVDYDSNSVTTYLTARSITSNHVKQDNPSSIFKTDVIHKYDGESYNIKPYDKFMDGSLKYVPVDLNPQTGVVNGQNLNLTFLYFNPKLDINLDTIKITTAKAGTQLPISMNFSQNGDVDRLGAVQYKLNVLDQTYNKVAFDKTFTVKDGVPSENLALDVSYVKNKGEKIKYLFNISIIYNDGGSVKTDTINLTTYGYTSTEKVLTNSDSDSANKYLYTGVAQTQQSRSNNQYVEKMERLAFEFNPNYKSKSGYGLNINLNPTFSSDINDKANMNVTANVPDKLVDSYLNDKTSGYASSNGTIQIPYENVNPTKTDTSEAMKFQFPHMNVEKNTGALFNDKQKANGDSNIKYKDGLRDGGHKFYLPIWANIDNYNYQLTSNTVGRNLVSVNLNAKINVYAQMYSTLDSKTTKDDQFLIEPVFPSMGNNDKQILGLSPSDWSWIKN